MWDFFERKVVLTCDDVQWTQAMHELARVGIDDYQKFTALPDIGPHQSFSRSVRQILVDFYESGAKTLLHLEDDCVFQPLEHLGKAITELPDDWDVLYLGANIQCDPQRVSEHLFRVTNAWTTHCIAYNRKVVPYLLENQPDFSTEMFDHFLGKNLGALNAFVVAPMVAYQRQHVSAIWGTAEDYTPIFEASDKRLREAA